MYHIKNDRRALRSAESIYEALVTLMAEKKFDTIKVKDIVKEAQIGRSTFYRSFDVQEDVLRWRCEQVVEGLISYLQEYRQKHQDESRTTILKPILRYFYLHSELIELLMKAKRIHIFEESFRSRFEPFKSMFGAFYGVEEVYVDYILAMRTGGITNILTHWIETGKKQAPDELADKLGALISTMVALEQLL